jgi:hypothetical protein
MSNRRRLVRRVHGGPRPTASPPVPVRQQDALRISSSAALIVASSIETNADVRAAHELAQSALLEQAVLAIHTDIARMAPQDEDAAKYGAARAGVHLGGLLGEALADMTAAYARALLVIAEGRGISTDDAAELVIARATN